MGKDPKSNARIQYVQSEVNIFKQRLHELNAKWKLECRELDKVKKVQEELDNSRYQLEKARNRGDFNRAGMLMHSTIPDLEHKLEKFGELYDTYYPKNKMLKDSVSGEAISAIVAKQTGIPVSRITNNESKRLIKMETTLRKRVVGQDHALEAVSNCIRLGRTMLHDPDRPLGNFLFLGPTGVGKTELCKTLADFMFDNSKAMTRVDMSEYGEKHMVSRLIGAPPGYIGYEEGGVLTESVRRRPYQILLLDEFEKAHPDVWNILLQLFDEGYLTDSTGKKVDFRNVIIVMTSNIGADVLSQLPPDIRASDPDVLSRVMDVV